MKVALGSSKYATKADLKNATGVDTSSFAKQSDLANLKSDVDKLDIDKLENISTNLRNLTNKADKLDVDQLVPAPVDLGKLRDALKINAAKKDVHNAEIKQH